MPAREPRFADEGRRFGRKTWALLLLLSLLLLLGVRAALPSAAKLGIELALSTLCVPKTRFSLNHGHLPRRIPGRRVARRGSGAGARISVGAVE